MTERLTVDVFITAYNEDINLIAKCLQAACEMRSEHHTWLLDDGQRPELEQLAQCLGVGYLTRADRKHAKAGNLNAALAHTSGEIIVIFDVDHIPQPDFLEQTVPYFHNPRIGFVQVMLTFSNAAASWIARAAIESSRDFYNATSIGADAVRGATLVGSNALIRRAALASIGGYQSGLAEDLATSIALHAAHWGSVYIRKPLAPGLAPPDLSAWFTQQLKWSRGVFELLLTAYPRTFAALSAGQKISYAVRMTYYWLGVIICLHLVATTVVLYTQQEYLLSGLEEYLRYLLPLAGMTWLIRAFAFRQWRHPTEVTSGQWRAVLLVYATWPIYTLAWIMAILRLPLAFRPTPKVAGGLVSPLWLAPQALSTLLLSAGILLSEAELRAYPLIWLFVLGQTVSQAWLVVYWLLTALQQRLILLFNQPERTQSLAIQQNQWCSQVEDKPIRHAHVEPKDLL